MKIRCFIFAFLVVIIAGCSKTEPYIKNQEKLLGGKVLQVDPQGPTPGFIRRFDTNEQAALARKADKLFNSLKEKGEIVSAHQYISGNFQDAGKVLKVLTENKIDVFVSGQEIIFGVQPGNSIYIRKSDQERVNSLIGAK